MSANGVPFKAQAMMRDLKQRLQLTVAGSVTYTDSLDANNFPSLKVVKGSETIFVHIEDVGNAGRVDGLGLAQRAYSPHKVQILQDLDTISDRDLRAKVLAESVKCGAETELWEKATLPSTFDLSGATLQATIKSDAINPLTAQQ